MTRRNVESKIARSFILAFRARNDDTSLKNEAGQPLANKLIIDADPGIGDALAIALALMDPDLDLVAVTATAGCGCGQDATRNVQVILDWLDPPRLPRLGSSHAEQTRVHAGLGTESIDPAVLNGSTGLGNCELRVAELHHQHESAKLIIDIVRTHPHEVTLLTLGPLTNVELAFERAPELPGLLKELVCLGGAVESGGDMTASAEFNIFADPQAARNVLRSRATKLLVPLDTSSRVVLTFDQFDRLVGGCSSRLVGLLQGLLPFAFRAHHEHLGQEGIRLHELVALCAITRPNLFESRAMVIDVETRGELTRGMTVFDRRGIRQWQTNIDVLHDLDMQGVLDYFSRIVRRTAA